jgi:predicted nucleic acid-binding protein
MEILRIPSAKNYMTDLVFVDTNILVYARDTANDRKQQVAEKILAQLWQHRTGRTSMQVLGECYATVTRKLQTRMNAEEAWDYVSLLNAWNPLAIDQEVMARAREIERRYRTSWWDATIVAAAQRQNCKTLLSEDFQDGMIFGQLTVRNPFAEKIQEPEADYVASVMARPRHRPRGRPSRATKL